VSFLQAATKAVEETGNIITLIYSLSTNCSLHQ